MFQQGDIPEWMRSAQSAQVPQIAPTQFNAPAQPKKRGMFAGAGKFLGDFAINYAANIGNEGAQNYLQSRDRQMQAQQRAQAEAEQYQQRRQDGFQDWVQREAWERANPAPTQPTELERLVAGAGIQPGSAEYTKVMKQLVGVKTNPVVMTPYGPMPYSQVAGADAQPEILTELPPGAKPLGGQTPPASGNFPPIGGYPRY